MAPPGACFIMHLAAPYRCVPLTANVRPTMGIGGVFGDSMEHLVIYFKHDIRDIIPYSRFIEWVRPILEQQGLGEYLGDDMAIDGGDAEAVFSGASARKLFDFLREHLAGLPFMSGAKVTLVFGELAPGTPQEEFFI